MTKDRCRLDYDDVTREPPYCRDCPNILADGDDWDYCHSCLLWRDDHDAESCNTCENAVESLKWLHKEAKT